MSAIARAPLELLFIVAVAPILILIEAAALALTDLIAWFAGKRCGADSAPRSRAVSVVIPTWNGRDHLAANLPSVVAALSVDSAHEVIVVDNGSTDGTAEFLAAEFPCVRVLRLEKNQQFGGGSNAGARAARNDILLMLNNDMRVEPDFLAPLLEPFDDPSVFAVTAQIHFSDPNKRREETGLVSCRWTRGAFEVTHVVDEQVDRLFPTFYGGGGSTAFDRRKFLELGLFDKLYHPFYVEDADLGYLAWKRGWKVLYTPAAVVYHEHRGTIGRTYSPVEIERIVRTNNLLMAWKNMHAPTRLAAHFAWTWLALWAGLLAGPSQRRPGPAAVWKAFGRTPRACLSRFRARRLARVDDVEAVRRHLGGWFRDRFADLPAEPREINILFFSPYGMEPPIHGGGVFMNQTARHLAELCRLHLLCLVDEPWEVETNREFGRRFASAEIIHRKPNPFPDVPLSTPRAAADFWSPELERRLHRLIYLREIDVVQFEYTQLAAYAAPFRRIATFLFEHDVYFQSVARGLRGETSLVLRWKRFFEYLRALRFERRALRLFDAVQVCTAANRRYLESYAWDSPPIEEGYRAGIDVGLYKYRDAGREPDTALFIGNFKHPPNQAALRWFLGESWPAVRRRRPAARLIVVGAQAPAGFRESIERPGVEFLGAADDIREPLARYAVFIAPILSGSGVRVKLLEAFAAGIPAVATRIGAEGLAERGGEIVELADDPLEFADAVAALLENPERGREIAGRARREVEERWDMASITRRLAERYRETVVAKRAG